MTKRCVYGCVCMGIHALAHTHTHIHKVLCYFKSISLLPRSAVPLSLLPKSGHSGSPLQVGGCRWRQGEGPNPSSSRHGQRDRRRWALGTVLRVAYFLSPGELGIDHRSLKKRNGCERCPMPCSPQTLRRGEEEEAPTALQPTRPTLFCLSGLSERCI